MLSILLSDADLIDKLYDEINRQNTFYFWIIGIVVTIAVAIAAFFGVLQWRLSDKQIEKMKNDTIKEIVDRYNLNKLGDTIEKINNNSEAINNIKDILDAQKQLELRRGITALTELDNEIDNLYSDDSMKVISARSKMYRLIDEIVFNKFCPTIIKASSVKIIYDKLNHFGNNQNAEPIRKYLEEHASELIKLGNEQFKIHPKDNK
ncbi:hypothetical protein [Limosilactobacillus vaginalis]|uniref:hypothetical protein n=1 Tax=Limosilactobacillus vaginalis TaxID=1633 RepID=UPI000F51A45A|nr:hypothetical protein [Limosilactobacillus vaginalis]